MSADTPGCLHITTFILNLVTSLSQTLNKSESRLNLYIKPV